eukprot:347246-Chlamydomonas_euryale.AAC.3
MIARSSSPPQARRKSRTQAGTHGPPAHPSPVAGTPQSAALVRLPGRGAPGTRGCPRNSATPPWPCMHGVPMHMHPAWRAARMEGRTHCAGTHGAPCCCCLKNV